MGETNVEGFKDASLKKNGDRDLSGVGTTTVKLGELRGAVEDAAEAAGETLSEFCRRAIERELTGNVRARFTSAVRSLSITKKVVEAAGKQPLDQDQVNELREKAQEIVALAYSLPAASSKAHIDRSESAGELEEPSDQEHKKNLESNAASDAVLDRIRADRAGTGKKPNAEASPSVAHRRYHFIGSNREQKPEKQIGHAEAEPAAPVAPTTSRRRFRFSGL